MTNESLIIDKIKMEHDALQRRLNELQSTSEKSTTNYADKEVKASFHAVQICTADVCHSVQYNYLRPLTYLRKEDGILCYGDGYKFEIEGAHMRLLFDLMSARAIAKIEHGEKLEIGDTIIQVKSVTAEPLEQEK